MIDDHRPVLKMNDVKSEYLQPMKSLNIMLMHADTLSETPRLTTVDVTAEHAPANKQPQG